MAKRYIVVIPARGGSKRLPNKNIKLLGGIPLIAHSILYAQRALPESAVWVSTDSDEIGNIAERYGANVVVRPLELASDTATTASVLQHLSATLALKGVDYDYMVLLQATNPLRPASMLPSAVNIIDSMSCGALVTFSPTLAKLGRIIDQRYVAWNYEIGQRSQDLEPLYYENGLLYITSREHIDQGVIFAPDTYPMVVDHPFCSIDIDTEDDLFRAEYYINNISRYE